MNKASKVVLGIVTAAMLVASVVVGALLLSVWLGFAHEALTTRPHEATPADLAAVASTFRIVAWMIAVSVLTFGLTVFYAVDAVRNPRLSSNDRVLWIAVIVVAGQIGMPVYWYLNIWRDPGALTQRPLEQG